MVGDDQRFDGLSRGSALVPVDGRLIARMTRMLIHDGHRTLRAARRMRLVRVLRMVSFRGDLPIDVEVFRARCVVLKTARAPHDESSDGSDRQSRTCRLSTGPVCNASCVFYDFHKLNSEFCSLSVTREVDGAQLPRLSTLNPSIRSGGSNIRQTFALIRAIVLRVLVNRLSATPALFTASVAGVPRR